MQPNRATSDHGAALERLLTGEALLRAPRNAPFSWSPEKRLAGAVLRDALLEVCQPGNDARSRRRIAEDLAWIHDDNSVWPFSFLRLCAAVGLDPAWVRRTIAAWRSESETACQASGPTRVSPPVPHAA